MKPFAKIDRLFILVSFLLGGCINLGPDYERPTDALSIPESYLQEPMPGEQIPYADNWWLVFEDPELNRIMEEVLAYNWDIERTAGRILELRALAGQTRADHRRTHGRCVLVGPADDRRFRSRGRPRGAGGGHGRARGARSAPRVPGHRVP